MRNLLPWIFILACPVMMLFMMRGMHGGGHATPKAGQDKHQDLAGHDMQIGHAEVGAQTLQSPDERITALEHELAQLRDLQDRQSDQDRVRGS